MNQCRYKFCLLTTAATQIQRFYLSSTSVLNVGSKHWICMHNRRKKKRKNDGKKQFKLNKTLGKEKEKGRKEIEKEEKRMSKRDNKTKAKCLPPNFGQSLNYFFNGHFTSPIALGKIFVCLLFCLGPSL